ncbi:MAG: hydroxymethylbilane synthase [Spirochaetes bacterium]|nr:hydroxymethylbilane synthase [Spirochaetota bacterium]
MIRIGTRGSDLALWQANHIAQKIGVTKTKIVIIKTKGDQIQNVSFDKIEGKGFFTKEIEEALLAKHIDCAVHSLKDLPVDETPGLCIAAITQREDPSDVILVHNDHYDPNSPIPVRPNSVVGTSSLRRTAQLLHNNPSLRIHPLRGNVPTRIKKIRQRLFNAIVLAKAGILRLKPDLSDFIVVELPIRSFLPSPGQGALAIQVRVNDDALLKAFSFLNDHKTNLAVTAERAFLKEFGAGCHIPLGAYAEIVQSHIQLTGMVASRDGKTLFRETITGQDPIIVGKTLAQILKSKGATQIL